MNPKPPQCDGCPLRDIGEGFVPGHGPTSAKLAIIGEAPGADEAREGVPFVGGAGRILNALLAQAGIRRSETFVDNVLRCRPPSNKYPVGKARVGAEKHCRQYDRIGKDIHPNVVVLAGDKALKLFAKRSGITRWRGSVIEDAKANYPRGQRASAQRNLRRKSG